VGMREVLRDYYLVDVTEWGYSGGGVEGGYRCCMCGGVWDEKYVRPVGLWENSGCCLPYHFERPYHVGVKCLYEGKYSRGVWNVVVNVI